MTRAETLTRRRLLELAAITGSVTLVAGCGGPEGEDDTDVEAEEGTGNGQDIENDGDEHAAADEHDDELTGDEDERDGDSD